ncbi:MAG: SpoIIE family protein phosphatase, partial [Flavobacteriales bacterium]|nr:SpoIIE family protein phosphatase [Flavobacteriales bacterium]
EIEGNVYFQTNDAVFVLNIKTGIVEHRFLDKEILTTFSYDGNLLGYSTEVGLLYIESMKPFFYKGLAMQNILSILRLTSGTFIITNDGIFEYDSTSVSQIGKSFSSFEITDGIQIGNNISIGTKKNGVIISNHRGNILNVVSFESGLQSGSVENQFLDHQQNLWLALSNGVSKIKINDPLSRFSVKSGINGTIEGVTVFNGIVYLATHQGIYYMTANQSSKRFVVHQHFEKVDPENIKTQCWDLLPLNDKGKLLAISNRGVLEIAKNNKSKLIYPSDAYRLYRSRIDQNRVFVGLVNGVTSLYYKNGTWKDEGLIPGVEGTIFTIVENEEEMLFGFRGDSYVYRTGFKVEGAQIKYDQSALYAKGLPKESRALLTQHKGMVLAGTDLGIYKLGANQFEPFEELNALLDTSHMSVHRIHSDKNDNIWCVFVSNDIEVHNSYVIGYFKPIDDGKYEWITHPFKPIDEGLMFAFHTDEKNISWIGGVNGLYRFDPTMENDYEKNFNTSIRKVETGEDPNRKGIFYGAFTDKEGKLINYQPDHMKPTFEYEDNTVFFTFASQDYESEDRKTYSFFLEGRSEKWSDWDRQNTKEYTNLPEGEYIFKVRGKNMYDTISEEATYAFTIKPPWFRTWWAYSLFILLGAISIYGFTYLYNANLRNIIKIRTKEVVEQKELVEDKNKDIMSSIDYAKKIQDAILPWEDAQNSAFSNSFVLFKPRDVVSGDFFWLHEDDEYQWICVADCTGHGVPGAFMSILGSALLNEVVKNKGISQPNQILDAAKEGIIDSLRQKSQQISKDGMDASLCRLNRSNNTLDYAGANNPLYIVRTNESPIKNVQGDIIDVKKVLQNNSLFLYEISADRMPVGYYLDEGRNFTNHNIQLSQGDTVYLFTDGFADQFGGKNGKKYKYKPFKQFLLSISQSPIGGQAQLLEQEFHTWLGEHEQIDDVCIIGFKV